MRSVYLTLLLLCIPLFLKAQECTYNLTGTVKDYHNKTVLTSAYISVVDTDKYAISNTKGAYVITGLCNGKIELEISHPECATIFVFVEINKDTRFDIKLEHHLEELGEVSVIGNAIRKKTNSAQENVFNNDLLEQNSAGNLGEALKNLGGVSSFNTGANIAKPTIHGLNGSRVLILNDGVRMQDMEWGEEHAPNVDINAINNITVVKGAAALQYGGSALGGVIVMNPEKPAKKDTLYGKTLINGMSNGRGGNISTSFTKVFKNNWYITGQGSYKHLGDYESPDYMLTNTGIQEKGATLSFGKEEFTKGFNAKYSYYNAQIAILRASHIGSVDDLIRGINSGEPQLIEPFSYDINNPKQEVTHHLGKLDFYKRFEGIGKLTLSYDFQNNKRLEFDVRRGDNNNRPAIDLELNTHAVNSNFIFDAHNKDHFQIGFVGFYQNNFANPLTGVKRLIPDYDKHEFGSFAILKHDYNDNLIFDIGLRYDYSKIDAKKFYRTSRWEERGYNVDYQDIILDDLGTQILVNPVFSYHNFSGTIGAQYTVNNFDVFKMNYALAQRSPNPSELFSDGLHHSAARIELGDLRITNETSHKLSFSRTKEYKNWGYTLEPYANYISDFILLNAEGVEFTVRGAFPVWAYKQINARLMGVDFSTYIDWSTTLQSNHQFSIVKGKNLDTQEALVNIPSANFTNGITYKKPSWNNFEASLNSNYVFKQNETPPNISVYSPEEQSEVLLEINNAPNAYHLLDFRSKVDFNLGAKLKMSTSLTIKNLLNTRYRDYLNRQRYFADDLGRNIILQLKINY